MLLRTTGNKAHMDPDERALRRGVSAHERALRSEAASAVATDRRGGGERSRQHERSRSRLSGHDPPAAKPCDGGAGSALASSDLAVGRVHETPIRCGEQGVVLLCSWGEAGRLVKRTSRRVHRRGPRTKRGGEPLVWTGGWNGCAGTRRCTEQELPRRWSKDIERTGTDGGRSPRMGAARARVSAPVPSSVVRVRARSEVRGPWSRSESGPHHVVRTHPVQRDRTKEKARVKTGSAFPCAAQDKGSIRPSGPEKSKGPIVK